MSYYLVPILSRCVLTNSIKRNVVCSCEKANPNLEKFYIYILLEWCRIKININLPKNSTILLKILVPDMLWHTIKSTSTIFCAVAKSWSYSESRVGQIYEICKRSINITPFCLLFLYAIYRSISYIIITANLLPSYYPDSWGKPAGHRLCVISITNNLGRYLRVDSVRVGRQDPFLSAWVIIMYVSWANR